MYPVSGDKIIQEQDRWAAIVNGMVRLSHKSGAGVGWLLAKHGYSDNRVQDLLRSRGASLLDAVYRVVDFLVQKDERSVNWVQMAKLLLSDPFNQDWRATAIRHIERDYYEGLTKKAKED